MPIRPSRVDSGVGVIAESYFRVTGSITSSLDGVADVLGKGDLQKLRIAIVDLNQLVDSCIRAGEMTRRYGRRAVNRVRHNFSVHFASSLSCSRRCQIALMLYASAHKMLMPTPALVNYR